MVKIQGEELTIQTLTVKEAEGYFDDPTPERLIQLGVIDPETELPVLGEEDMELLAGMEAGFAFSLRYAIQEFNGFLDDKDSEEGK